MANFTVKMPAGSFPGVYYDSQGNPHTVGPDGLVTIPSDCILPALAAGCQLTSDALAAAANIALTQLAKLTGNRVLTKVGLAIGTTVTLAYGAHEFQIGAATAGVNTFKHAAAATAKALGALGTIPASKWGIIVPQEDASGTCTFKSVLTGFDTEALAIAALPAPDADKAPLGYITVLASASTWIAGTDAFQGGTGGNPATTTHYYDAGLTY